MEDPPAPPTIESIVVADPIDAWQAAGFSVDADDTTRVGQTRIRLVGRARGKRIIEWSLRNTGDAGRPGIDGLPTSGSTTDACAPAVHPNGVIGIDHIVLMTPDVDRTVAAMHAAGFRTRRTRMTDTYGAPFVQTFFRAGEVVVELIGPEEPSGDGPALFFGLAYTVTDIDATRRLLGDALSEPKDAVQPGRRIATLRHKQLGLSVATAFMSPEPEASHNR